MNRLNQSQKEPLLKRAVSSGLNLLMIASFMTAPASIVLLPTHAIAAPAPFPKPVPDYIKQILKDLKDGKLSDADVKALKDNAKGSAKTLDSIINRINQLAQKEKLPYRLSFPTPADAKPGDKIDMEVYVRDLEGNIYKQYDIGTGTYNLPPNSTGTSTSTQL